ncbi:DsbA family oxidoreductase [Aquincola tertiaricarbonis]|uniref:DsbA family oxidoreductase n=1 Tax=Aquincola tertiaricarbonis TaxID=391953 RepID=A0ABY4SHT6_AQUTE|nr:DsbA family oxidoreductase [Aquincola tertiaricarbonis]URI11358.1 DsbA family oxidoreductase [Aquincola tertiaricarbonis]
MKIDFVSDVSCPWCAIGLTSLESALAELEGEIAVDLHFQPFELNPDMAPEGEDINEHLTRKYRTGADQNAANRETIRQRGEQVGFNFNMGERTRIYNTFDAHRLLHWAGLQPDTTLQLALKKGLLAAYFTQGCNPSDHEVLVDVAGQAGLDPEAAREVLASGEYADEVREAEQYWQAQGIRAVPSVVVNHRHLLEGGQPPEVYLQVLRQIAAESGAD